ncbi:MAG: hypothetical protein HYX27_23845 [Acidobacteria bacterium]|nr:hypothetical protein [Acidobacteriota bacterium]
MPDDWDFGNAFRRGFRVTVRFLQSRGAKGDVAEEIAQAAWVRGWEMRAQLTCIDSAIAWVNGIAKNMFKAVGKTIYRDSSLNDTDVSVALARHSHKPVEMETLLDFRRVLRAEEPRDCAILGLFYQQGYATQEIAVKMGLSPTAVRIRLFRLRRRIRQQLKTVSKTN